MSTTFMDVAQAALRRAGVTTLPGTTPSDDQTAELIPEVNRMMASRSIDGLMIYDVSADRYAMSPSQTDYYIGPTGDWVAARPIKIFRANVVVTSSDPELHLPVKILTDEEWAAHTLTELPASWPWELYMDASMPDALIHLFGYPTEANDLELFTWKQLKSDFSSTSDAVVFPPGYEDAMVKELACRIVTLYPLECRLRNEQIALLKSEASLAWERIAVLNTVSPKMYNEAALLNSQGGGDSFRSEFYQWGTNR